MVRPWKRKSLILVIAGFLLCHVSSFATDYLFKRLTANHGLSGDFCQVILQDDRGYIWIQTSNDLNRFDGSNLKVFKIDPTNTKPIPSIIHEILSDGDFLWISTLTEGLIRYNTRDETSKIYKHNANTPGSLSGNAINLVYKDSKGRLWVGTTNGLNLYNADKDEFSVFTRGKYEKDQNVNGIVEGKNDVLWTISHNSGLYKFNIGKKTFTHIPLKEARSRDSIYSLTKIFLDKAGILWLVSSGEYMYGFDTQKEEVVSLEKYIGSDLITKIIISIIEDLNGKIWFGSQDGGIYIYDPKTREIENLINDDTNLASLSSNRITCIFRDRSGIMWVGTDGNGINIYDPHHLKFNDNFPSINKHSVKSNRSFKSALQDCKGNWWIGTDYGLNKLDKGKHLLKSYSSSNRNVKGLLGGGVSSLYEDKSGKIYVGTWGSGLYKLDPKSEKFYKYSINPNTGQREFLDPKRLFDGCALNIVPDERGHLWIGNLFGNVDDFDPSTGIFRHIPIVGVFAWGIVIDSASNSVWTGTDQGLFKINRTTGRYKRYVKIVGDKVCISSNVVNNLICDKKGFLWIATNEGLNRFDPRKDIFKHYTVSNGLLSNHIQNVTIDNKGFIWVSTDKGISRLDPQNEKFLNYTDEEGVKLNSAYCYKSKSGEILFGGINGLTSFYPEGIINNNVIPNIVLTGIKVFYKQLSNGDKSPLKVPVDRVKRLVLSSKESVVTFEFVALNFTHSEKNQYACRLDGVDPENIGWNYLGPKHEITYSNLRPGKYIFRVSASNNDNVWNENGLSIELIITPPFWETWWFRSLIFLFILIVATLFYFVRINTVKKQNKLLELKVEERTRQLNQANKELIDINLLLTEQTETLNEANTLLEERQQYIQEQAEELKAQSENLLIANDNLKLLNSTKDKFFSIIAHDLKNPFNAIMGFSELLKSRYDRMDEAKKINMIELINSSSKRVYKLLENLLYWARSQTNNIEFNPVKIDLNNLVESNISLLKEHSLEKKQNLISRLDKQYYVLADINMVDTILRNLINNAVKFTQVEGTIEIHVEDNNKYLNGNDSDFLKISVKDNGIGMKDEIQIKLFQLEHTISTTGTSGERGTGLGLLICKEFVEKNGGQIWVESTIKQGSTFTFSLPAFREALNGSD